MSLPTFCLPKIGWMIGRGSRIELIRLRLELGSGTCIVPVAITLRDETLHPGSPRGLEQVIRALRAEAVGERELLVEVLEVRYPGQAGELVDDDIRPGCSDRLEDRRPVKRVCDDTDGAGLAQSRSLLRAAGHRKHLMTGREQLWNETLTYCAGCTGDEYLHT